MLVFIAFPAADANVLRQLAAGEKACMMSDEAVRMVLRNEELMKNKRLRQLAKSLVNDNGHCYERSSARNGVQYAGDLKRYHRIMETIMKGGGNIPNCQMEYAEIMDAYDEAMEGLITKLRYTIINNCHREKFDNADVISELTLAHAMCYMACLICEENEKFNEGNEFVLCADPKNKAYQTDSTLLSAQHSYPMRKTDYVSWFNTLDEMVGCLLPKGAKIVNDTNIDYGLEGILRKLCNTDFVTKTARENGIRNHFFDKDVDDDRDFYRKYFSIKYKR